MNVSATYNIEVTKGQQMGYGVTTYELVFRDSSGVNHVIDAYALYLELKEYFDE